MRLSFDSIVLSGDQVPLALPLIQATWPGVDLPAWEGFVGFFGGQAAAAGAGMLALRDATGCVCGVIAYRPDWDLQAGPVLSVPLFTAVDLANSLGIVRALLDAADVRAAELRCACIQIRLRKEQGWLSSRLRALGLAQQAGLLWRKVEPAYPAH